MGRDRVKKSDQNGGRRRRRHRHEAPLPSAEELDQVVRELIVGALRVRDLYRRELFQAMGASGSSELHVSGGEVAKPTERAWAALQGEGMADCREAAKAMRDARDYVRYAHAELGGPHQPPVRDPRAIIGKSEFDEAVHARRERELRGEK